MGESVFVNGMTLNEAEREFGKYLTEKFGEEAWLELRYVEGRGLKGVVFIDGEPDYEFDVPPQACYYETAEGVRGYDGSWITKELEEVE